jgi:FSR family fosmidomycin resistance protein-like MFS transporter
VGRRQVNLALLARFVDELLSGLPDVLMPTIRAQLGLSYLQVSALRQVLDYVSTVVEPIAGLFIDVWPRRWLMGLGAVALGVGFMTIGAAPTFMLLLLGYAFFGVGSGPMAHTADVVLVETHPQAVDRISTRSTIIDTMGALLAPLLVTVTIWLGLSWRWPVFVGGAATIFYGVAILRTRFPQPAGSPDAHTPLRHTLRANLTAVLRNRQALFWALYLLLLDISETRHIFVAVWLVDEAGFSQAQVGLYAALEMGANLVGLLTLEQLLLRYRRRSLLLAAGLGVLLLYPAWVLLPGIGLRFLLGSPLSFLLAFFWPIGRAQLLASAPGRAGTTVVLFTLFRLLPLPLLLGGLAESTSLTATLLWVPLAGFAGMFLLALALRQ